MSKMTNTDFKKGLRNALLVGLEIPEFYSNCHYIITKYISLPYSAFWHLSTYLAVAYTFKVFSNAD